MQKIYIGNLSFETGDTELQQLFTSNGFTVESARVIRDMNSGRSRGFGFVEMASAEEAGKAIAQLNGSNVDGRALQVNEAKPQAARRDGGHNRGGGGGRRY